ncbi:uncharacterized protein F4822DRAFT_252599 [Hypoxylon trugodes]|uniref:uncharacterized protein n=1 Tax=Hypoxylon trugodes TaxID=326681 RepID=UPI00219BCB9B|nr:uncharacterized protein F4822DRAFT_252599 [Hypoxylon trugodes]KAI1388652.1 hypothetical protein F4822DRAFT_252599 [Hypoxylon trugodes]
MDFKKSLEEPPPYTAVPTNVGALDEFQLNTLTSHLQRHVATLPGRIRETQEARRAEQTISDASLLDHIVPIVEEFLADLANRHGRVPLASLTLVPDTAVPKNAMLSGLEDMKRRGELCRISRVSIYTPGKDSKSSSGISKPRFNSEDPDWAPGQEFTDWGRFGESSFSTDETTEKQKALWWQDEEMAHRLASYLQPKREKKPPAELNSIVEAVVEHRIPQKKKRGWNLGKRTSDKESPEPPTSGPSITHVAKNKPDEAEMTVTVQEVAFRRENEFGIWESIRGWGIVVVVRVGT